MPDLYPAAPEIFLLAMACVILLRRPFLGRHAALDHRGTDACHAGRLRADHLLTTMDGQVVLTFSNMFVDDLLADFLKLMLYLAVIVVLIYSRDYLAARDLDKGEYYLLVLFATLGMMVMISAAHFLTIYLGLELLSLSLYALVAIDRDSPRATEAAMKYFVLGALASGLLLYGMSMIYGATGTLEIGGVAQALHLGVGQQDRAGVRPGLHGLRHRLQARRWCPSTCGCPTSITARRRR